MDRNLKLPDPETFTRAELAERWKCDISRINRYIEDGQLKEGFNTFKTDYNYLRELRYFVAYNNKDIWGVIMEMMAPGEIEYYKNNRKEYAKLINSKIVGCPKYLYMSVLNPKDFSIPRMHVDAVKPSAFDFIKKMFPSNHHNDLVIRFCDLENNTLFPMRVTTIGHEMVSIKKPKLEDLIIPLEEVLRFEKEHGIGENKENVSPAITKKAEKKQTDTDTHSPKTIDNAGEDRRPPAPERILRMREVSKRSGISRAQIYNLIGEGKFPKSFPLVPGGRSVGWYESVIDEWIRERDEQKRKDGADEADE